MKKTLLSVCLLTNLFINAQSGETPTVTVINGDFSTDKVLTTQKPADGGWYGNTRATIEGGQARFSYGNTGGSWIRQQITFDTAGKYKLEFNVGTSDNSSDGINKNTYVTFREENSNDFVPVFVKGSSLPVEETVVGSNPDGKNFQTKSTFLNSSNKQSVVFRVEEDNLTLGLYISINKDTKPTAGENDYFFIDNVAVTYVNTLSNNHLSKFNFSLSPNPAKNHIALNASKVVDSVEIYNSLGQSVKTVVLGATSNVVNIAALNKGVYIAKVNMAGLTGTYRFIKQ